jgi:hypothetical protein
MLVVKILVEQLFINGDKMKRLVPNEVPITSNHWGKSFGFKNEYWNKTGKQVTRNGVGFRQWGDQNFYI